MKRSIVVLVFLSLASLAWGQSLKEQSAALQKEAAPLLAQREVNKKTLAALNQTKDDIDFGVAALTKSVNQYKVDLAAYSVDLGAYTPAAAQVNAELAAHNANRCTTRQGSSACDGYNAEAERLNARRAWLQTQKDDLDRRKGFLDQTRSKTLELQQIMSDKTVKYTADAKVYNDQNNVNEAKIADLSKRWQTLLASLGDCFKKLPNSATDEMIHEACGERWDGNVKHPVAHNQGTGGVTSNK